MEIIDRKFRDTLRITDPHKRILILSKYLYRMEMEIKELNTSILVREYDKDGSRIIIEAYSGRRFKIGQILNLSKILGRYIEIKCTVAGEKPGGRYLLNITDFLISQKERTTERIKPPLGVVWVTNVKTNAPFIDTSFVTPPTFVKITFNEYENKLKNRFEQIKIDCFNPMLDERFTLVKETCKTLFIHDTSDKKSYEIVEEEEEFINLAEEGFLDINKLMHQYKMKGILSEMIMPIIYVDQYNSGKAVGYIHIQSKSALIEHDQVMELKILTFEMIDRIRESNFIENDGKYEIIDMSLEGLRIRITNRELKEQLRAQSSFYCDIFFKMQSAINVKCEIRFMGRDKNNDDMILGLKIVGYREGDRDKYKKNLEIIKKPASAKSFPLP